MLFSFNIADKLTRGTGVIKPFVNFIFDFFICGHDVFVDFTTFFHNNVMEKFTSFLLFIIDHIFNQLFKTVHMETPIGKV